MSVFPVVCNPWQNQEVFNTRTRELVLSGLSGLKIHSLPSSYGHIALCPPRASSRLAVTGLKLHVFVSSSHPPCSVALGIHGTYFS